MNHSDDTSTNVIYNIDSPSQALERIRRIKSCPHWSKPDCGCAQGRCAMGKGKAGLVSFEECGECLGIGGA